MQNFRSGCCCEQAPDWQWRRRRLRLQGRRPLPGSCQRGVPAAPSDPETPRSPNPTRFVHMMQGCFPYLHVAVQLLFCSHFCFYISCLEILWVLCCVVSGPRAAHQSMQQPVALCNMPCADGMAVAAPAAAVQLL